MKKLFLLAFLALSLFVVGVYADECNANLNATNGYVAGCTVSSSLTLNGTYNVNINGSTSGAIAINGNNVRLDCNGTRIFGNWSQTGNNLFRGLRTFQFSNVTIINCTFVNYNYGFEIVRSNGTISYSNFTRNRMGIYIGDQFRNFTINNNFFNNNTYADIWLSTASMKDGGVISNNTFYTTLTGIREETTSGGTTNLTAENNVMYQYSGISSPLIQQTTGKNWLINNNTIVGGNVIYSHGISLRGALGNNYVSNNLVSYTQYGIALQGTSNDIIIGNTIFNGDQGGDISGCNNISWINQQIRNMTFSYDSYNAGLLVKNSSNIFIQNINISEIATVGIVLEGTKNISITNPRFDFIPLNERIKYSAIDGYEPRCAIQSTRSFKGYYGDLYGGNNNLTLSGGVYDADTPCYLHLEDQTNIYFDINDFWYRAFKLNQSYTAKTEFYIPNTFYNLTRGWSDGLTRYDLRVGNGTLANGDLEYQISKSYTYFKNINKTSNFNVLNYNSTNSLVIFSNSTALYLPGTNLNYNITLTVLNYTYIYPDYALTEGRTLTNEPFAITSSTKDKISISSTLSNSVQVPIILTLKPEWGTSCENVNKLTLTPKGGAATTYTGEQASTQCKALTSTGLLMQLNPSSSSNEIEIDYGTTALARTILKILIGFLCLLVVLIAFIFLYENNYFETFDATMIVKFGIILLLVLILTIALVNYIGEIL